ncbi:MAG: nicotinate (nicotinamide) nucleotide adenylyltransferase [Acholeplasmatales bacterium]|nr:nicotinate (nicotinamide) nucleotide adenylyltransferase [Acholeplasmatales bacterium]
MRIGVYGGCFNPCHLMHKRLVDELLNKNIFDRIIILPTGDFYNKSNLLKGEIRKKMLEIMFDDDNRVIVSDYEFKNNLIYTFRSLDYVASIYKGDDIYFILGSDNLLHFDTWKRYEYILDTYNLLVVKREGIDVSKQIERFSKYKGNLDLINLDLDSTSSSKIRDLFYENKDIEALKYLDKNVYDYIVKNGFYKKDYVEKSESTYKNDEEFLKNYNSDSYLKLSLTTDITLFGVSDIKKKNYRENDKKAFSVLLVKRNRPPFKDMWCLPGGFLSLDETLSDCTKRVLSQEAGLESIYLEQLYTFDDIDRDIRGRVLSCSYMGLIDINKIESNIRDNARFFNIAYKETNDEIIINFKAYDYEFESIVKKEYDEFGIVSYKIQKNDDLAFDHLLIITTSIMRLRSKINYTDIVFHMMPNKFTLKELQLVYEAILDKKLLDPVFRRDMKDKLIKLDEVKSDGGHRPAALYKYKG